jgi:CO/xanthine dehydrogenase FAD-binding subunit
MNLLQVLSTMWMAGGVWFNMAVKEYIHVDTVQEAIRRISDTSREYQLIAGGAGIAQQRKDGFLNCDVLVDISRVKELTRIEKVSLNDMAHLKIGSGTSMSQAASDEWVERDFPLLADVLRTCCDPARRNAYTFGGRLATRTPLGMLFPALCVLKAQVLVQKDEKQTMLPILDWMGPEVLEEPYLITAILIPYGPKPVHALLEVKRRSYPGEIVAGVLAAVNDAQSKIAENVQIFASVDKYGLVSFAEIAEALNGKMMTSDLIQATQERTKKQLEKAWDETEDAQYRKNVLTALVSRCLNQIFYR